MTLRRAAPALAVAAWALAVVPTAGAHGDAETSFPEPGQRLAEVPPRVWIRFNEPVDPLHTSIEVLDSQGSHVEQGATRLERRSRAEVELRPGLAPDGFIVRWRTLSAVDGHPSRGSWAFAVGNASLPTLPPDGAQPLPFGAALAKAAAFVGLAVVAGSVAWDALVQEPHGHRRLVLGGAALQLAALVALASSQAGASGLAMGAYLSTPFGRGLVARILVAAALLGALAAGGAKRSSTVLAAFLVAALAAVHGAASHTAGNWTWLGAGAAVDALHLVAVATWSGALLFLFMRLREGQHGAADVATLPVVARGFSRIASWCLATAALTGIVMLGPVLGIDLDRLQDALAEDYGMLLLAKLLLVALMIGMGAVNRYAYIARMGTDSALPGLADFRANVRREALVGLAIFLAAGALTNLPPP